MPIPILDKLFELFPFGERSKSRLQVTFVFYRDEIETHDQEVYKMRSLEAEQIAREIAGDDTHAHHDKLDSGASEEDKFSSVRRPLSNSGPLPGRSSNMQGRSRGRSRGSGFQGFKDHVSDLSDSQADGKLRRNSSGGTRRHETGKNWLDVYG